MTASGSLAARNLIVTIEQALWTEVRVLEQHAALRNRMSARADSAGMPLMAEDRRAPRRRARAR